MRPGAQAEKSVAKKLEGTQVSELYKPGIDVETNWLSIEVKSRKLLPLWITGAVDKARRYARPGQLGIAILHQKRSKDDLVVMRMSDFKQWFGDDIP